MYTRVLSACPLLGGLSSFRVFFIGGFTVLQSKCPDYAGCPDSKSQHLGVPLAT